MVTVLLTTCGGDGGDGGTPGPSPVGERPASTGELNILAPGQGETVSGDDVGLRLRLLGATITDQVTTEIRPDEGHIHLSLDGETLTLLGSLDENLAELAGGTLEPGPHLLEAEFVAADHAPFNPRVIATVTFTVE